MGEPLSEIHWWMLRSCLQSIYAKETPEHLVSPEVAMVKETATDITAQTEWRGRRGRRRLCHVRFHLRWNVKQWMYYIYYGIFNLLTWPKCFSQDGRAAETILGRVKIYALEYFQLNSIFHPIIFSIVALFWALAALKQKGEDTGKANKGSCEGNASPDTEPSRLEQKCLCRRNQRNYGMQGQQNRVSRSKHAQICSRSHTCTTLLQITGCIIALFAFIDKHRRLSKQNGHRGRAFEERLA